VKNKAILLIIPTSRTRNLINDIINKGYIPIVIFSNYDAFPELANIAPK
jgi:hypothetical protein